MLFRSVTPQVDYTKVRDHVRGVIAAIEPNDSVERFTGLGVNVILGAAKFTGPNTVEADGKTIQAKRFVIATGSTAMVPPIPGLDGAKVTESLLRHGHPAATHEPDLEQIPERLQDEFGYAPLTAADKELIFGRNLAGLYGVDVNALRQEFPDDSISNLKAAYNAEGPEPSNTAYGWVAG